MYQKESCNKYDAFKTDAIRVGMPYKKSLSEEVFMHKYKGSYDLSKHGSNIRFLLKGKIGGI